MIKRWIGKILRYSLLGMLFIGGGFVSLSVGLHTKAAYQTMNKSKLSFYSRYTAPLKTIDGKRYCSSSYIKFKNKSYAVTNKHCCEAYESFEDNTRRVGNRLEKILFQSPVHDVCVLTATGIKSKLTLAKKDVDLWESILIMGYPRGFSLTPSAGVIITKNVNIQVGWTNYVAHEAMIKILPGNSGSPVFNSSGKVVGLAYGTYIGDMTRGILVPLKFVKEALQEASQVKD